MVKPCLAATPRELPLERQTLLHERESNKELGHRFAVLTLGTLT